VSAGPLLLPLVQALPPGLNVLEVDAFARLLVAGVLGAVIGLEREITGKEAGLRTMILICVGAALFTELSLVIGAAEGADASRIAANIVTGIGFLGAGTILHQGTSVRGMTTAATIWVVAAVGMAAGAGDYVRATGATLLVLLILVPLRWWEERSAVLKKERSRERPATGGQ
jgi:putative Mg2+ transporter-C (MgtC) family protein